MMEALRNATKSWVAAIFIGLLVISFAVWGINDIFTGGQATTVARVGDAELDVRTFENEYASRIRRQTNAEGRPMTAAEGRQQGLDRLLLEAMISDLAVLEEARRQGISASDAMVRTALGGMPGILAPDGSIDRNALDQALRNIGYTETEFLEAVRFDLMRSQLMQTAAIGAPAPRGIGLAVQAFANERRAIDYAVLPLDAAGPAPEPDDATLQAFMETNAAAWTAPELRALSVLSVGPKDLIPAIEVTDEEVAAHYELFRGRYETLETRELQQIVFPTREEAEAAKSKLAEGKTFDDLVAERQLRPEDVALGTISKGDPAVPAGAFETPEGEVSAPLEGPFGWALIKVLKVNPGSLQTLDEVRDEIRTELATEKALDQISNLVTRMQDALAASDGLEEAAKELGLTVRKIPAIDAQGNDAEGKPVDGLPDGQQFLRDAFELLPGERTDVSETKENVLYAVMVDGVTPAALRPLDSVRDAVKAAWVAAQFGDRLKAAAEAAAKQANDGGAAPEALKSTDALARDAAPEDLSPALLASLFETRQGVWIAGPAAEAPLWIVARVREVSKATPEDALADERSYRGIETRELADDLTETFRQEIVKATDVRIDEALFERTRRTQ